MRLSLTIFILFFAPQVIASNFGDLPSVLPAFWLVLIISIIVSVAKARVEVEGTERKKFRFWRFLMFAIVGFGVSLVLLVLLWLSTL